MRIFPVNEIQNPTVKHFVNTIAPLVCNEYLRRYKSAQRVISPSVVIAQAGLESGWNLEAKTLFGIKGEGIELDTTEYIDGEYVLVKDSFANFESIDKAIQGYYDLMQWDNYDDATNKFDAVKELEGLTNDIGYKYATAPNYKSTCLSIIADYELVIYDSYVYSYYDDPAELNHGEWVKKVIDGVTYICIRKEDI